MLQASAQATGAMDRKCRESVAERHSPSLEIEGRQVYRLQSPRLEGRHLPWFESVAGRCTDYSAFKVGVGSQMRETLTAVGKRRKAGVHVIVAEASRLKFQELAGSAQGTALLVLQPLGWRIAEDPNKCLPFSWVFSTVGSSFFAGKGTPRKLGDIQQGEQAASLQGGQAASFEDDGELGVQ